jgi:CubicO group peptidase (beta-lactamase class C family)
MTAAWPGRRLALSPNPADDPARMFGASTVEGTMAISTWWPPAGRDRRPNRRRADILAARWWAPFVLCVLLLAPWAARAEDDARRELEPRSADFQAIDAYVASQMEAMHIPGIALGIVRGDEIVHVRGFGVANPAGQPMTGQTPVILGSTSKSVTALAVMQLVEAGKIDLDAPARRYLPWFRVGGAPGPDDPAITVRQLLNHTSGIPTDGGVWAALTGSGDETIEQEVRALGAVAQTAPAGTTLQYSNGNYVTLGLLVETVSGQSYESYVQEHVFAPLRMRRSFVSESDAMRHGMATGYRWWFGLPVPASLPYLRGSLPAGWLISSAEDMAHYLVAQLNDGRYGETSVLSPEGIAQLHRPAARMDPDDADGAAYAMGWVVRSSGEPTISHTGDTSNFHSDLTILPARRLGVVVLMNVNGHLAGATNAQSVIAQGIQRLLLGRPPPAPSGFWPRYLVFDAALLLCSALATWSLPRLLSGRGRRPPHRPVSTPARAALPLLWEIALPVGLLIGLPFLSHASWPLTLLVFPDLGYWLLALCAVLLATGGLRVVLAVAGSTFVGARLNGSCPPDPPRAQ